ncbi:lipoprotein LipO [Spirochaetia bacterium]|nr:lipoprotein LipO [Spirochaetia bacterium]
MKRCVLFAAVVLCLTAQVFAGGGSQSTSGNANEVTLTMVNRVNADVVIDNNPLLKYIREKFGFNIQLEAPPISNYNDRLMIIMASGDLPDIIYTWNFDENYQKWAQDGLIHPVNDLVKKYPNILHNVTPEMFEAALVPATGKAHAIPRPNAINHNGYVANTQWLAKLGVKAPTTIDEFYEYGKKVATGDPDGNGRADTYLYSPVGSVFTDQVIMGAFIPNLLFGAPDFDGVYKIREKMNGYYPYLEFMRKLYAEKILDPEYFVNKMYDDGQKVRQGRVALYTNKPSNMADGILNNNGAFGTYDVFPGIKAADGKVYNYEGVPTWGGWMLPVSSTKTGEALRFIDWANSPEGFTALALGIPGQTYNSYDIKTRKIDQTDDQRSLLAKMSSSYMTIANTYEGDPAYISNNPVIAEYIQERLTDYQSKVNEVMVPPIKNPEWDVFLQNNPDLNTRKLELENKVVIGDISLDEFKAFINNEWLPRSAAYEATYLRLMAARK